MPSIEQSSKTKVNKSGKIDYSSPPVGGSTLPYSSDDSKMKNEQKHYKDGAIIAADPSHASNHTDVRYSVSPSGGPPAPSGAAGISESNYDFSVSNAARPISRIDAGDEFAVVDSRKKENDPQSADRGIKKKAHPGDSLKLLTARTKAETINLTKAIPERLFSQPKKTCNDSNKHPDNPSHVKSTQAAEFTTTNKEPSTPGDEDLNSGTKISPIQDKKIPHNLNIAISHYKQNPPSKSKDTIGTGSIFSKVSQKSKNITSAGFQSAHSGDNYDHRAKASENGAPVADNFVYKSQKGSTGRPSDKRPLLDIPAPAAKLQQIPCDVQSHTVTDPDEEPHASPMRQQLAQKGTNDARTDLCDMPSAVEQSGVKDNISANEDAVSDNTQPRFAPSSSITPPATPGPGKRFSWFRRLSNSIKESQNNNKGNMARYNKS